MDSLNNLKVKIDMKECRVVLEDCRYLLKGSELEAVDEHEGNSVVSQRSINDEEKSKGRPNVDQLKSANEQSECFAINTCEKHKFDASNGDKDGSQPRKLQRCNESDVSFQNSSLIDGKDKITACLKCGDYVLGSHAMEDY